MREFRSYGSVRGAPSNGRPYREAGTGSYWPFCDEFIEDQKEPQAVIVRSGKLPFNVALPARLHFVFSGGPGTIAARSPALGAGLSEMKLAT